MTEKPIPGGYILLSRKLIESEIYDKPPLYLKVWIYILSKAFYQDKGNLKRGQLRTSIPEIQDACSWFVGYRKETPSKSKIYRIIDWLRKTCEREHEREANDNMIETTNVTQGMLITIVNYNYYQDPKNYERNSESNNEREATATRPKRHRNNKKKNLKNLKNKEINNKHVVENKISIGKAYEQIIGQQISTSNFKMLLTYQDELPDEVIVEALKKAKGKKAPFPYAKRILNHWVDKNVKSMADIDKLGRQYKENKSDAPGWYQNMEKEEYLDGYE